MSIGVSALVWRHADLTGASLLILLAMADFADDDGTNIYPSHETLRDKARCDQRTLTRALKDFETAGLVACVEEEIGKRGRFRRYSINLGNLLQQSRLGPMPLPPDRGVNKTAGQNVHQSKTGGHDTANRWAPDRQPVDISSAHIETHPRPIIEPSCPRSAGSPEGADAARAEWSNVLARLPRNKITQHYLTAATPLGFIGGKLVVEFQTGHSLSRALIIHQEVSEAAGLPVIFERAKVHA